MQQDGSEHIHLHDSGNEDDDCGAGGPATAAVEKSGSADGAGGVVAAESTDVADEVVFIYFLFDLFITCAGNAELASKSQTKKGVGPILNKYIAKKIPKILSFNRPLSL
jgi:hypothetical protein